VEIADKVNLCLQRYASNEFNEYRTTGSGQYQFQGQGDVAVTGNICNDNAGCVCRNSENTEVSIGRS